MRLFRVFVNLKPRFLKTHFYNPDKYHNALYNVSGIRSHSALASNFAKADRFAKFVISHRLTSNIFTKVFMKFPTTPQTRRYTTL